MAQLQSQLSVEELIGITIKSGNHSDRNSGVCIMEAVAWVAGEPHSDHPECACPVITKFLVNWNDSLPSDQERDRLLKPLIPLIIGTRSNKQIEKQRSDMAFNWFLTVYTPAWLEIAGLKEEAELIRKDPSLGNLETARSKASAAESVAWSAARSVAWSAAWSVAWSAAWSAAESAAWSVARSAAESAAESAAWSAAWSAAESVAWSAAWSVAWSALQETVTKLQTSAIELVNAMIALTPKG